MGCVRMATQWTQSSVGKEQAGGAKGIFPHIVPPYCKARMFSV